MPHCLRNHIAVLAFAAGLVCYLLLSGCAGDERKPAADAESQRVAQAVSDSLAGIEAAKAVAPSASQILDGAAEYALSAAGTTAIPVPHMTAAQIQADPNTYFDAGTSARQHADGSWLKVIGAAALGLLLPYVVAAGRFLPGAGPLIEPIAGLLTKVNWFGLATKDQKAADKQQAAYAVHATAIVGELATVVPDYRARFSPAVLAAIDTIQGQQIKAA